MRGLTVFMIVSTHSRAKAAAHLLTRVRPLFIRFNTQPREGGCIFVTLRLGVVFQFQHTAARRRLLPCLYLYRTFGKVSTHSRAKAAAPFYANVQHIIRMVSTHSRAKAAAPYLKKQEKSAY